jgi:hypothetical protein
MDVVLAVEHTEINEAPPVDAKVLDGPAIVNMLKPNDSKTFNDYVSTVIQPYIEHHLRSAKRLDIVFDRYFKDSLKSCTRSNRGDGVRRLVKANRSMPNNWSTFLRCDENKTELFPFIVKALIENLDTNELFVGSLDDGAVANQDVDLESLMPCNIEEADERMFVHVQHAAELYPRVLIKTVDSDVVVIAIGAFNRINNLLELWIEFGVGKHLKYIPIHEIANSLGPQTSTAFLFFHAFSGCDTTSSFKGKGKKSFHGTWKAMPNVTPVFERVTTSEGDVCEDDQNLLEQFAVSLYSSTFDGDKVNDARRYLFTAKAKTIENIPPTAGALHEHVKRSTLQARKWFHCLEATRVALDPEHWGWMKDGNAFFPVWSLKPDVSQVSEALIRCGCTHCVGGRCKCKRSGLDCTELCECQATCS